MSEEFTGYDIEKWADADRESLSESALTFAAAPGASRNHVSIDPRAGLKMEHQRRLSSCTGHGITTAAECCAGLKVGSFENIPQLSRMFAYLMGQRIFGNFGRDAGCGIKAVVDSARFNGIPLEKDMPYPSAYSVNITSGAIEAAKPYKIQNHCMIGGSTEAVSFLDCGFGAIVFGVTMTAGIRNCRGRLNVRDVKPDGSRGGHCVPPDAIIAGDGMKRAADVVVGDSVIGHDGEHHPVTEVFTRYFNGNLCRINCGGAIRLSVTEDHPVLVYRRAKSKLMVSQSAGFADTCDYPEHYRNWMRYESGWICAKDVRPGDYLATPRLKSCAYEIPSWSSAKSTGRDLPQIDPLDEELAWVFGYYIGNGSTDGDTIEFSVKNKELTQRIRRILLRSLRLPSSCVPRGKNGVAVPEERATSFRVRVHSSVLAIALKGWFGDSAHTKRFPDFVIRGWQQQAILDGLIAADGCEYQGATRFQTVSPVLSQQVRLLLATIGERYTCHDVVHSHGTYPNARHAWCTTWKKNGAKTRSTRLTDDFTLSPVRSVFFTPYSGTVYNFEVDDCHSYVADTLIVHNCMTAVGYVEINGELFIIIANSWGTEWGAAGYALVSLAAWDEWATQRYTVAIGVTDLSGFEKPRILKQYAVGGASLAGRQQNGKLVEWGVG